MFVQCYHVSFSVATNKGNKRLDDVALTIDHKTWWPTPRHIEKDIEKVLTEHCNVVELHTVYKNHHRII